MFPFTAYLPTKPSLVTVAHFLWWDTILCISRIKIIYCIGYIIILPDPALDCFCQDLTSSSTHNLDWYHQRIGSSHSCSIHSHQVYSMLPPLTSHAGQSWYYYPVLVGTVTHLWCLSCCCTDLWLLPVEHEVYLSHFAHKYIGWRMTTGSTVDSDFTCFFFSFL